MTAQEANPKASPERGEAGVGSALEAVRCPGCASRVDVRAAEIACGACGVRYPRLGDVPILLAEPFGYLASCRRQLALLERQALELVENVEGQVGAADVLPTTRRRCLAMTDAVRAQLADVQSLLAPLLSPGPSEPPGARPTVEIPATVEYLHYLYRDWGWPAEPDGENERALANLEAVLDGRPPGRTLVLGAGGCRLAYDLHKRHPGAEVVALDIDPLLFGAASAVCRGERVPVREANLEIGDLAQGSTEWVLTAPDGPVDPERFHLLLADGVDPPFAPGAFDTVVTPWFIDQGPEDLRDFISTVHGLLRPGGRWVDLGPLLYEPGVPIALRFGREELFDLAARCGFRIDGWRTESAPYLVSKLNSRGKVEWVLAFAATRLDAPPPPGPEGPPAWLLFPHLPVPSIEERSVIRPVNPGFEAVMSAVDGRRTIDDIARLVARQAKRSDVPLGRIRAAVRQCLAELHPACRGGAR